MKRVLRPVCFGLIGVAVLGASLAGTGLAWTSRAAGSGTAPEAAEAEPGVVCFGHADVEGGVVPLFPGQSGRVIEVLVREGQTVQRGAILLRIDDRAARSHVREAEADLRAAEAQREQARQAPEQQQARLAQQRAAVEAVRRRLSAARHLLARKQALQKAGHLHIDEVRAAADQVKELEASEQAEQEKVRELELARPAAGVAQAEADVAARRARLEQARLALDECSLKAPADGTVLRVLTRAGEVLGAAAKQPAVQFCPAGPRIVRAEVEQEFAAWVTVDQVATLTDDTGAGARWQGRVVRLSDWYTHRRSVLQDPLQFNDVRTLECIVQLDPGQPPLRIGQRVRVALSRQSTP